MSNIGKAMIIVEEMMNDRGYFYSYISEEDKNEHYIYTTIDKKKNTVVIFARKKEDISKKNINKYISSYDKETYNILIIVSFIDIEEKLPSKYIDYENDNIQVFHIKNVLFNITKHKYVPKHSILSEDDKKNLIRYII